MAAAAGGQDPLGKGLQQQLHVERDILGGGSREDETKSGGAISRERQCHGHGVGPGGITVGLPQGGTAWPELGARAGTGTKPGLGVAPWVPKRESYRFPPREIWL